MFAAVKSHILVSCISFATTKKKTCPRVSKPRKPFFFSPFFCLLSLSSLFFLRPRVLFFEKVGCACRCVACERYTHHSSLSLHFFHYIAAAAARHVPRSRARQWRRPRGALTAFFTVVGSVRKGLAAGIADRSRRERAAIYATAFSHTRHVGDTVRDR